MPRMHLLMARLYNAAGEREKSAAHGMLQTSLDSGSSGEYRIWIYWTEGRVFIYQRCR